MDFLCPVSVCFIDNERCLPPVVCGWKNDACLRVCVSSTMDGVCHRLLWFENDAVSPCVFYRRFPGCSFTRSCTWNFQISITLIFRMWPVPLRTPSNDDRFSCILVGNLIDRGAVRRQTSCTNLGVEKGAQELEDAWRCADKRESDRRHRREAPALRAANRRIAPARISC